MKSKACGFSATVAKVGLNPCVEVPKSISKCVGGKRSYVPVEGALNGFPIRATLVPAGKGRHRLYINGEMRKKAKVAVGDVINLVLSPDSEPRSVAMRREFAQVLGVNKTAKDAFERLAPSHQREILIYLNFLKKPESVKRNIEKVIERLLKSEASLDK